MFRILLALAVMLTASMSATAAHAQKRLAMVVGVSNYDKVKDLPVADLDSKAVAKLLKDELGFEVTALADPTRGEIEAAWTALIGSVSSPSDVIFFYYAGHGIELRGGNYLIPREVTFDPDPGKVIAGSVSFQDMLDKLAKVQESVDATAIFVLDACRENPFAADAKATQVGLAPLSALPKSVFVLYSAGIGQLALEGKPPNSVYTTQLLQMLRQQKAEEQALADLAQRLRHKVYLDALQYQRFDKKLQKYVPSFQTPAYYDQLRARLSLFGNRIDKVILEPVGSSQVTASQTRDLNSGDILRECEQCPELAVAGPGSLKLDSGESGKPVAVSFDKTFAIGRFEVTNAEWNACVSGQSGVPGGCKGLRDVSGASGRDREPVSGVNWYDAQDYVFWLNKATKQEKPVYRLPSEAEWEFAARAGAADTPYSFGNDKAELCRYANGADSQVGSLIWVNTSCPESDGVGRKAAQVGSFKANAWGLFDVHGNVAEWVQDCWRPAYGSEQSAGAAYEIKNPEDCARRVVRGGSWRSGPDALRSSARNAAPASIARSTLGFRVVRELQ